MIEKSDLERTSSIKLLSSFGIVDSSVPTNTFSFKKLDVLYFAYFSMQITLHLK